MNELIIGGGIGGLTTALCLHQAGFTVWVYESADQIKPLGVCINLLPHCVRVLTSLGLLDRLAETAVETQDLRCSNKHGQLFWEEPSGRHAGITAQTGGGYAAVGQGRSGRSIRLLLSLDTCLRNGRSPSPLAHLFRLYCHRLPAEVLIQVFQVL